jgi:predicted kinase
LEIAHLRGDKIGLELFRIPTFSAEERRLVYEEMEKRAADELHAGRHVVYDAAVNTAAQRRQLSEVAARHGGQAIGLWIQTDTPIAKRRAGKARDSGLAGAVVRVIPPQLFDQYVAAFEEPGAHEIILSVSGQALFYLQYRRLRRQMQALGIRLPLVVSM